MIHQDTTAAITEKCYIAAYTRNEISGYSSYLGESVHFAVSIDNGQTYQPLFHNYGMAFAKCHYTETDNIISAGIRGVAMYQCEEDFVITAREILREHEPVAGRKIPRIVCVETGKHIQWTTKDFIEISDPIVSDTLPQLQPDSVQAAALYSDQLDIHNGDCVQIEISAALARRILAANMPVVCKSVSLPEYLTVTSRDELENITAAVSYTDGSIHQKRIDWDLAGLSFQTPGEYVIHGKIRCRRFPFPVEDRPWGDPVIVWYHDRYYFTGTDDQGGQTMFEVREAETPEALFMNDAKRSVLLSYTAGKWEGTFWAPEFHVVNGRLCLFCTLSTSGFDPQAYIMMLREGGDVMNPADWSEPKRCVMPDGRYLCENPRGNGKNGITLDMTYFESSSRSYAIWSYRSWNPGGDSGSMLMIGEIDPDEPWRLVTEPMLLTRPEYAWENNCITDNNEGPNAIVTADKIYLVYSGGHAGGDTYVLGMMTADVGADLMKRSSWKKSMTPVLASNFVAGEYGCGHCSFLTDEFGDTYITYHGHKTIGITDRIDGVRRVHFLADGSPLLSLTADQDLPADLQNVSIRVAIQPLDC